MHLRLSAAQQVEMLQRLQELDLSHNKLGPTAQAALRAAAGCSHLRVLRIVGNPLAASPRCPAGRGRGTLLRTPGLGSVMVGYPSLSVLARSRVGSWVLWPCRASATVSLKSAAASRSWSDSAVIAWAARPRDCRPAAPTAE